MGVAEFEERLPQHGNSNGEMLGPWWVFFRQQPVEFFLGRIARIVVIVWKPMLDFDKLFVNPLSFYV